LDDVDQALVPEIVVVEQVLVFIKIADSIKSRTHLLDGGDGRWRG
jgi:hypothetical protein